MNLTACNKCKNIKQVGLFKDEMIVQALELMLHNTWRLIKKKHMWEKTTFDKIQHKLTVNLLAMQTLSKLTAKELLLTW